MHRHTRGQNTLHIKSLPRRKERTWVQRKKKKKKGTLWAFNCSPTEALEGPNHRPQEGLHHAPNLSPWLAGSQPSTTEVFRKHWPSSENLEFSQVWADQSPWKTLGLSSQVHWPRSPFPLSEVAFSLTTGHTELLGVVLKCP